jgi:hypothetical protein
MSPDRSHKRATDNPSGLNGYAYASNDPGNRIDVAGTDDCLIDGCQIYPGNQCFFDPLDPTPNPQCPPGTTPPPPRDPTSRDVQPIQCDILLWHQSALFKNDPAQHTYIQLFSHDPNTGNQSDVYLEGFPSSVLGAVTGTATLDKSVSVGSSLYSTPASLSQDFYKEPGLCQKEIQLAGRFNSYKNGTVTYNGLDGPNSNSFTWTLLHDVGLDSAISFLSFAYLTLSAPGWGVFVPGL